MMREHRSLAPPQLMDELYRRKLLHWRTEGATYFVTWRLASEQSRLAPPECDLVAAAVRAFDGQRYRLAAWVVMDDHVHVLLTPLGDLAPREHSPFLEVVYRKSNAACALTSRTRMAGRVLRQNCAQ
jgi:REP element-mobilizing transposase RayT